MKMYWMPQKHLTTQPQLFRNTPTLLITLLDCASAHMQSGCGSEASKGEIQLRMCSKQTKV